MIVVRAAISCLLLSTACACTYSAQQDSSKTARIFIAGDSTAADYPDERAPQIGWGQTLRYFVTDPALIQNRAVNGRSSKSYIDEGRWTGLVGELQAGDIVLISFGHNDSRDDAPERYAAANTDYRNNLIRFVQDVRGKGATSMILSSAARRLWVGPAMVETHGLYRLNAERAAEETGTAYLDLAQASLDYFETIGREETKADFLWLAPNPEHVKFPDGVEDNTHFTELGACGLSLIVAQHLASWDATQSMIRTERFPAQISGDNKRPELVLACAREVSTNRLP